MLKSIRQFFQSILLGPKEEEIRYFEGYLNIGEKALFRQVPRFEKVHAVLCAKKIKQLLHNKPDIDERNMVRAALLHDIGRITGKISLFDKIWLKIIKYSMRPLYNILAEKGREPASKLRNIYVHKYHGEAAKEFLRRAGTDESIIDLIARHAQKPRADDSKELKLLRQADKTS